MNKHDCNETGNGDLQAYPRKQSIVIDAEGKEARVVSARHRSNGAFLLAITDDGAEILLPTESLAAINESDYRLFVPFSEYSGNAENLIAPVHEEEMQVGKRTTPADRGVRLHKHVTETLQQIDIPLTRKELNVMRVPIGRMLEPSEALPQQRQEGNTLVIPVLEEVLVVEKRIRLVEEIRVEEQTEEIRHRQAVPVKAERIEIERFHDDDGISDDHPAPPH